MTEGLEAITTATLAFALNAASLRQQIIATNIANANSIDYVPQRLNFEAQLDQVRRTLHEQGTVDAQALASVQLKAEPVLNVAGRPATVQLDVEMAGLAQNAVQYQALIKGLSRQFEMMSLAVSDGKK